MPFSGVRNRTRERFAEVQVYLSYISSCESCDPMAPIPIEIKIMKGLYYVHLYAALEKSVNDVVQTALSIISSKRVQNNHFLAPLLSIALVDQMKSLKGAGYSNLINQSIGVFKEAASTNVVPINETALSNNLQNIWIKTIEEVFESLCMPPLAFSPHEKATVNEVVGKRNAVAHGRDSAAAVGERHRVPVLREQMAAVSIVTSKIIDSIEEHCMGKKYIKPNARRHYV